MLVHCDQPDLMLAYIGGAAGRMLVHTVMLSPELHTWDQDLEQKLQQIDIAEHAKIKLDYIKQSVFPDYLSHSRHQWKKHEPVPWGSIIEKTKKTIRHCWMYHSFESLERFGSPIMAFVDYSEALHFVIRAGAEKKTLQVIDAPPTSQEIIVDQLHKAEQFLKQWCERARDCKWHKINLQGFFFQDQDAFQQEYYALCEHYGVTPVLSAATSLREHWLSLQWQRRRLS